MKPAVAQSPSVDSQAHADDGPRALDAVYAEYVRGFDDVPVLNDAIHVPPRPRPPPDFRRGERPDVRKEPRPDAYTLRETTAAELASLYAEYCGDSPTAPSKRSKGAKRGVSRRKSRGSSTSRAKKVRSAK